MGARKRISSITQLKPEDGPLLVVATGQYVGDGFDCPRSTPCSSQRQSHSGAASFSTSGGSCVHPGKYVVEVHDYHDADTGVLASSLSKRAPGYVSLGFPDPRRLQHLPPDVT
jgi:hypothetical protein